MKLLCSDVSFLDSTETGCYDSRDLGRFPNIEALYICEIKSIRFPVNSYTMKSKMRIAFTIR